MKTYDDLSRFWFNVLATGNACLGFAFFGYNITISNGVGPYTTLNVFANYTNFLNTLLWAAPLITAAISTLIAGALSLKIGRRKIMMISDVFGIIGVLLTIWPHWVIILIGRLVMGVTMGVTSVAASLYFTEITPPKYRGELTNGPTVFAAIGILLATLLNLILPNGTLSPGLTNGAWRSLLGLGLIPSVLRLIGFTFFFRYETPHFYVNKRQYGKATRCLLDFYNGDIVERIREIVRERDYVQTSGQVKVWQLCSRRFSKAQFASVIMFALQYLSGFNLILAFTGRLYAVGVEDGSRYGWLPGLLGVTTSTINLLAAVVSIWTTSRFGRRTLVVYGIFFTGLCLLLYGVLARAVGPENLAPKIFLVLWPIPWNLSLGSVINVITAETLPDIGVAISVCVGWIFGYLTFQFYPKERAAMGRGFTFLMYGIIVLVGSVILWFIVIETRGKTKDQILKEYSGKYAPASNKQAVRQEEALEGQTENHDAAMEADMQRRNVEVPVIGPYRPSSAHRPHKRYFKLLRRNKITRERDENEREVQQIQDQVEKKEVLSDDVINQIKAVEAKYYRKVRKLRNRRRNEGKREPLGRQAHEDQVAGTQADHEAGFFRLNTL